MERKSKLRIAAAVVACAVCGVLLVFAELAARSLAPLPTRFQVWEPGLKLEFEPRPQIMPGVEGRSLFAVDELGFRADPAPAGNVFRVLCIGGSTTECLYLDQSEAWPMLLQRELERHRPTWVANAGRSGHSTREHVVHCEELLACEPRFDLVLLLCGANDLGKRLARDTAYDPDDTERPGAREALVRSAFAVGPAGPWDDRPAYKRTALWSLASRWRGRSLGDPRDQDKGGEIYLRWRELRAHASVVLEQLPDLESALGEYERNLGRCADACARHGARLVLINQACLWREDLPAELAALLWMGGVGDYQRQERSVYYSATALAQGLRGYNDALATFAAERELELIDLDAVLPKDTSAFYDDVHLNEAGARAAAAEIARHLLSLPPYAEESK